MNKRILISLAVIALLAGGVAYAMWQSDGNTNDAPPAESNQEDPNQPINEADERDQENDEDEGNNSSNQSDEDKGEDNEGNQNIGTSDNDRENISPIMSSWNYSNGVAQVRAYVDGATDGTCTVVFERAGQSAVEREAPIGLQGTTHVCQGFDVERSAFPASGDWTVRVEFSSDSAYGASQTESIRIP